MKKISLSKRIIAIILMIMVVITTDSNALVTAFASGGVPTDNTSQGVSDDNLPVTPALFSMGELEPEEDVLIMVNGQSALLDGDAVFGTQNIPTFAYNTDLSFRLNSGNTNSSLFAYLNQKDYKDSLAKSAFQNVSTLSSPLKPGNYYLSYVDTENSVYLGLEENFAFGFVIQPVKVSAPENLSWSTEEGKERTAIWSEPTTDINNKPLQSDISKYEVSLYKGDTQIKSDTTTETFYDFADIITENGYGQYTYTVKAVIDDLVCGYESSDASAKSSAYAYVDTIKPEIVSYAIADTGDCFTATAKDNVGVTAYAFCTSDQAPSADASVWTTVSEDATSEEGLTKIVSGEISASGTYYLYVKDASNNIVGSKEFSATNVNVKDFYYATIVKDVSSNILKVLLGDNGSYTLTAPRSKGQVFEGYYADADFTDAQQVSNVELSASNSSVSITDKTASVPLGYDFVVYPKWTNQQYKLALTSDKENDSMTYNGSGENKGMNLTVKMEPVDYDSITYVWEKKVKDDTSDENAAGDSTFTTVATISASSEKPFESSLKRYHVNESGIYRVTAKIMLDGQEYTGTSNELTVNIQKAPLQLMLADREIAYKDPVPTDFAISTVDEDDNSLVVGLQGEDTYEELLANGELILGGFTTTYDPTDSNNCTVGTYQITEDTSNKTVASDYKVTITPGTLKVVPKNVTDSNVFLRFKVVTKDENEGENTQYLSTFSDVYTGSAIKPEVVAFDVKDLTETDIAAGVGLINASNYTVEYSDNVNVTSAEKPAKATVTFKNNYTGTLSIDFAIVRSDCNTNIIMKNADHTNAAADVDGVYRYTYGDAAIYPALESNPTGKDAEYYYYSLGEDGNAPAFDKATGTKVQPVNAGKYAVYAYIPESDNYNEIISSPVTFEIKKRVITFTAASETWSYDGKEHRNDTFSQEGTFAGSDGYKTISVTGVAKEMTTGDGVANVISCVLSPTTNPNNYEIHLVNGWLKITGINLTTPSGFAFDTNNPGVLTWTPLSVQDVDVKYEIKLYQLNDNGNRLVGTYQTDSNADSYDLTEIIRSDARTNEIGGYVATIQSLPSGGSAMGNYLDSAISAYSNTVFTTQYEFSKGKDSITNADTITRIYRYSSGEEELSTWIALDGETLYVYADYATGYDQGKLLLQSDDAEEISYYLNSTVYNSDNNNMYVCLSPIPGKVTKAHTIKMEFMGQDKAPVITKFQAENILDENQLNTSVQFTMEATDDVGIKGYALITAESAEAVKNAISNGNININDFQTRNGNTYQTIATVKEKGTHYLIVWDTADNYTIVSDKMAITIYEIGFNNGKTESESEDLYNSVTMTNLYKTANSSIKLPAVKYTKTGYTFKDWKGADTGVLYNDQAVYSANASDTLIAEWSNEQYRYQVDYYYMDTNGEYSTSPTESKIFTGGYHLQVSSSSPAIQNVMTGFSRDTSKNNIITLGDGSTEQTPVVSVYYKREQYTITYSYEDPENPGNRITLTKEQVAALAPKDENGNPTGEPKITYYYGENIVLAAAMTKPGYTFSGWNFGDFDTSQTTMPAKNLEATAFFSAGAVNYDVVVYLQNAPTITTNNVEEWTDANQFCEIESASYTKDVKESVSYISTQGANLTRQISDAPKIDGFTCIAVVGSINAPNGDTLQDSQKDSTSMSGKVDETEHLYINYYYQRNRYTMTLNVWKDKRDVEGNKMYSKSWTFSYGRAFSTEQIQALENYGYDEEDVYNQWIKDYVNGDGTRKDGFQSYILADYTDFSCGSRPASMPYGDVTITKEYVEKTTTSFEVQIYLEGLAQDGVTGTYSDTPSYNIYYYDAIGKNIKVDSKSEGHSDDNTTSYIHYDEILNMLDNNAASYTLDKDAEKSQMETKLVDEDAENASEQNVIRIYMARNRMESVVTYYYRKKGDSNEVNDQVILQYTVSQVWGSTYQVNPGEYFYGNGTVPSTVDSGNDGITAINDRNEQLLQTNFNDGNCVISYSSYQYFVTGSTWDPTGQITSVDKVNTPLETKMGQGTKEKSNQTYINIYYTPIDVNKTFRMRVKTNTSNGSTMEEINLKVGTGKGDISSITENGSDVTGTYADKTFALYYANKKEFYEGYTTTSGTIADNYKALQTAGQTYDYTNATLKSGYKKLEITTQEGTGTYYLDETSSDSGLMNLYIANATDSFYEGNRISSNIEDVANKNGAKLGRGYAESIMETGYSAYAQNSYGIPIYTGSGEYQSFIDWTYNANGYYYYRQRKPNQQINLVVGSKQATKEVEYGTLYNPLKDDFVKTTFTVDEGYRIVWYQDADKKQPITETDSFEIKEKTTFYGNREKDLITNYDYVSYELSDRLQKNDTIRGLAKSSKDGFLYITEDILNRDDISFDNATEEAVLASKSLPYTDAKYQVIETESDRSYVNNEAAPDENGNYPTVAYKAKKYSYYINGELVLIKEENKSLSYSAVSLDYSHYDMPGLFYSEANTANKTQGYCQKEPITLSAYFYRQMYEESVVYPSSIDPSKSVNKATKYKSGSMITEVPVTKPGYRFDGWIFSKTDAAETENQDNKLTETELSEIGYQVDKNTQIVSFSMPPYNLTLTAKWVASDADYDVISYYQKSDQTYPTSQVQNILSLAKTEANVKNNIQFHIDDGSNTQVNGIAVCDSTNPDNELAYAYTASDGYTYYFDASDAVKTESDITVSKASLLAAVKTVSLTTENKYQISDYLPPDLYDIYQYSFSNVTTANGNESLNRESEFMVQSGMTLSHYYVRSANFSVRTKAISIDSKADAVLDSGVVVNGTIQNILYGETVSLTATVASGYEFKGFYPAKTLLGKDFAEGTEALPDVLPDAAIEAIKNGEIVNVPYTAVSNEDGTTTYTSTVSIGGNSDYIAVSVPMTFGADFNVSVEIVAGNSDYTYGYEADKNNYLTAKVTLPAGKEDKVSIIGYQWYRVDSIDGSCSSEHAIDGATSSTFLIPQNLDAGNYYYQCVVTVKRTDNGREGDISASHATELKVKKYGENPTDVSYVNARDYLGIYDGNAHGISFVMGRYDKDSKQYDTSLLPNRYRIYYSTSQALTSWTDVESGLTNGAVVGGDLDSPISPDATHFKDVEYEADNTTLKSHVVYYYVRTEEDGLDQNFKDVYGSAIVRINPITLTFSRTTNAFVKQYDNNTQVRGDAYDVSYQKGETHSDFYRLVNGETTGETYFTLKAQNQTSQSVYEAEKENLVAYGDVSYNAKDVENANAVNFTDIKVYYKNAVGDHQIKDVNYNYKIATNSALSVSARITPYPLELSWSDKTDYIYNGSAQAPQVEIKDKENAPNDDLEITSLGAQVNTGNYQASASLVTRDKNYTQGDYSFDVSSLVYTISPCYITVLPKSESKIYNGNMQYLTSFAIEKSDDGSNKENDHTTVDVATDGTCTQLPTGQKILMSAIKTDKGGQIVGDYSIQTVKDTVKIYDSNNQDVTYNYMISAGSGTLSITNGTVKITGVTVNDKTYDATTTATIKTKMVTLKSGNTATVLDGVTIEGICENDEVYVDAAKVTEVVFENSNAGDNKKVTFTIASDALIGEKAGNYTLDLEHSVKETTSNIRKAQINVKVNNVSTIYGITPNYGYTLSGFQGSDSDSVVSGAPTYLLGDGTNQTNYETDAYKYSYTYTKNGGTETVSGTKISVKEGGYVITLETDSSGLVKGMSADNYDFIPDPAQTEAPAKLTVEKRRVSIQGLDRASVNVLYNTISKEYDNTVTVKEPLVKDLDYHYQSADEAANRVCEGSLATWDNASGLLADDMISLSYQATYNSKDVETADSITAKNLALTTAGAGANYELIESSFEILGKITPKTLTLTVDNKTITYGDSAPVYTASVTGYVPNDDGSDENGKKSLTNGDGITLTCEYDPSNVDKRKAGDYAICVDADSLTNKNYRLNQEDGSESFSNGILTVNKKTVELSVKDVTIVYGKEAVPAEYTGTFNGWVSAYGDTTASVLGEKSDLPSPINKIHYTLEPQEDYPYKEDGYIIAVTTDSDLETDNYEFTTKNGTLFVSKQYLAITGVTISNREYDGTTNAPIDYSNPKNILFTCYIVDQGNVTFKDYTIDEIIPELKEETDTGRIVTVLNENVEITGTYQDKTEGNETVRAKDVGVNKPATLGINLKAGGYLDSRFRLIPSNATAENMNDYGLNGIENAKVTQADAFGTVTQLPITIQVYYSTSGEVQNPAIKYGEEIQTTGFRFRLTSGSFVKDEGIADTNLTVSGKIVDASGNAYTKTSGAGIYYVRPEVTGDSSKSNYAVTVMGKEQAVVDDYAGLEVKPDQLKTPEPVWSETNPGTVTFSAVSGIGLVDVAKYVVTLYQMDSDDGNTSTLVTGTDISATDASTYSFNFASDIRNKGAGSYIVNVQAIASVDDVKNPVVGDSKKNVLDSKVGETNRLFAAKVSVAYADDMVTANAATTVAPDAVITENRGKVSYLHIANLADVTNDSYLSTNASNQIVMISGEKAAIKGEWFNKDGYRTGYALAQTPFVNKQGDLITNAVSVSLTEGGNGIFTPCDLSKDGEVLAVVSANLTSSKDIIMQMPLEKRSATLEGTVETINSTATYGYASADAPHYKMNVKPSDTDNLTASDYEYTYQWKYQKVGGSVTDLFDQNQKNDQIENQVMLGLATGQYLVYCDVTAKRKDNGDILVVEDIQADRVLGTIGSMIINKAVVSGASIKAVTVDTSNNEQSSWMYGCARLTPALKVIGSGSVPTGIGKIHYYFTTDSSVDRAQWTEWTDTKFPEDAGTYYLYAKVDTSTNYEAFETTTETAFNIEQNKLGALKNNLDTQLATEHLAMNASGKAPYGIATWPGVHEPKENGDSTTNCITANYVAKLYKYNSSDAPNKTDVSLIKTYTTVSTEQSEPTITSNPTGIFTVDMTDDLNAEGVYYYTVQALSNNQENCANSDVIDSADFKVFENIKAKDADNHDLLAENATLLNYTYDARDITLYVSGTDSSTYKWFYNGEEISDATGSEYKLRYVEQSGSYSCQITSGETTFDTSYVDVTISPRTIKFASGSDSKGYDGSPLVKDEWWICSDSQSDADGIAVSMKSESGKQLFDDATTIVEKATKNQVSGMKVTGTKTNISLDESNNPVAQDNTMNLDGVVIREVDENGTAGNTVYSKDLVDANKANYILETAPGSLSITKKAITLISGSDTKFYDTKPLTKQSYQLAEGCSLANGDQIKDSVINYPNSITNVLYDTDNTTVKGIENKFNNIQILNASSVDVTDNYDITLQNGLLTVNPRGEGVENGNADFELTLTVDGQTAEGNIFAYTGSDIEPVLTIKDKSITQNGENGNEPYVLKKGTDYEIVENTSVTKAKAVTGYQNDSNPTAGYTINVKLKGNFTGTLSVNWGINDVNAPTGKISVASNAISKIWEVLLGKSELSFQEIFDKSTASVTISAEDSEGESGIDKIFYYVYSREAETDQGLDVRELEGLSDDTDWTEITNGGNFTVNPDKVFVIYAKITDKAGHTTYLSSNGIVLDKTAPILTGEGMNLVNEANYCKDMKFKVTETNLKEVTDNGTAITSSNDGVYTVTVDTSKPVNEAQQHVIKATDKAGNSTEYRVTLYSDHQYDEGVVSQEKSDTQYEQKTFTCTCEGCGHQKVLVYPDGEIIWKYDYSYTDSTGNQQSGVVGSQDGQRSQKAKLQILQNGNVYNEQVVEVTSTTGSLQEEGKGSYQFSEGLPYQDAQGQVYNYTYQVIPLKNDGVTEALDYEVSYQNKVATLQFKPDLFEAEWKVIVKGDGIVDAILPETVNVKILFATQQSAADSEYTIISQQVNDDGVICNKGSASDDGYVYEGAYPVWKYQAGKTPVESYYYRMMITGCTINGNYYDLSDGNYKSAVSEAMTFNASTNAGSCVMTYTLTIDKDSVLPILYLDKNADDAVSQVPYILKEVSGMPVTADELKAAAPQRTGYTFKGWYDQATGGIAISEIEALNQATTLYAHWRINGEITDINVNASQKVYDGQPITAPVVTGNNPNAVYTLKYKKQGAADSTYSTELPKDAGTYTVMATMEQDDSYTSASLTKDFTIQKRPVTVTWNAFDKQYDGTIKADVVAEIPTGVLGETLKVEGLYGEFAQVDVGNDIAVNLVTDQLSVTGVEDSTSPDNYEWTFETGKTANISKRNVSVKAKDVQKHVGESDPAVFEYDVTDMVRGESLSGVTVERETGEEVGEYDIEVTVDENLNPNYAVSVQKGIFTISDHVYTHAPLFDWAEDYETCDAIFSCDYEDDITMTLPCVVTKEPTEDYIIYTATVENAQQTYTDKQYVTKNSYVDPDTGYEIRLVLRMELGVNQFSDELVEKGFTSQEIIFDSMEKVIMAKMKQYTREKSVLYDVDLQISRDKGVTWQTVTENDFPDEGLMVEIPYPETSDKEKHDFMVVHMFAHDFHGHQAGDCEIPDAVKAERGIRFKVSSLSPILISWEDIKIDDGPDTPSDDKPETPSDTPSDDKPDAPSDTPSDNKPDTPPDDTPSSNWSYTDQNNETSKQDAAVVPNLNQNENSDIPKSGDEMPLLAIWILFIVAILGTITMMLGYIIKKKKEEHRN